MIDRTSRDRLAENIRHLVAGVMSNFEYEAALAGIGRKDKVIWKVMDEIWLLYDDRKEHRLQTDNLAAADYRTIARFLLFLKSDQEYRWPSPSVKDQLMQWLSGIFSGQTAHPEYDDSAVAGDPDYWPFFSEADFERAKETPVYLSGKGASGASTRYIES